MSETEEIGKTTKKETFMQSVVTLIFSQVLIKLLGLVYNLYLLVTRYMLYYLQFHQLVFQMQ